MLKIIVVGVGGLVGAIGRHILTILMHRYTPGHFPYGTLVVNVLGCLALGLVMELVRQYPLINQEMKAPITVGLLGAFTSYSTFAHETMHLVSLQQYPHALLNVSMHVLLGLAAVMAGAAMGRAL